MPADVNVYTLVGGMFLVATIIMTPLVIITGTFEPLPWPWGRSEWAIVGMAANHSYRPTECFSIWSSLAGPVFASQTAYVVTLSGVLWGIMIFNDEHSLWVWLSLGVMMLALALVTPRKDKSQPAAPLEHANKP